MVRPRSKRITVLIALIVSAGAFGQFGHPLVGTWSGYWQAGEARHRVLLLLDYDGDAITGVINPGRSPAPLTRAVLDPSRWTVTLEGRQTNTADENGLILIEGTIENPTSATQRAISGTWTQGGTTGNLRVTLN